MKIFIYSRKSKWTGRGESVENQLTMCREYIQYNIEGADKAEIVEYEDEGYSGKNTNRPQFQKMMSDIKQGGCNYLVCYKLGRGYKLQVSRLRSPARHSSLWNMPVSETKEDLGIDL